MGSFFFPSFPPHQTFIRKERDSLCASPNPPFPHPKPFSFPLQLSRYIQRRKKEKGKDTLQKKGRKRSCTIGSLRRVATAPKGTRQAKKVRNSTSLAHFSPSSEQAFSKNLKLVVFGKMILIFVKFIASLWACSSGVIRLLQKISVKRKGKRRWNWRRKRRGRKEEGYLPPVNLSALKLRGNVVGPFLSA